MSRLEDQFSREAERRHNAGDFYHADRLLWCAQVADMVRRVGENVEMLPYCREKSYELLKAALALFADVHGAPRGDVIEWGLADLEAEYDRGEAVHSWVVNVSDTALHIARDGRP